MNMGLSYLHSMAVLCFAVLMIQGAKETEVKRLYDTLMTNYSSHIRPVEVDGYPVYVYVTLALTGIVKFDELSHSLWSSAWLDLEWTDELLFWNNSEYSGIKHLVIPQDKIWVPDLVLSNFNEEIQYLSPVNLNAAVYSNGLLTWQPGNVFKSQCKVDTSLIPFDIQTCQLKFEVWSHSADEVSLTPFVYTTDIEKADKHGEWEVISVDCSVDSPKEDRYIIYEIQLRRKPMYIVVNTIVPVMLLSIINIFVFKVPVPSGERLSFAITTLLSFAVFLSYMASFLPQNGEHICYMSAFILSMLLQSTVITLIVVFTLHAHHNCTKIPKCIKPAWTKPCCRRRQIESPHAISQESSINKERTSGDFGNYSNQEENADAGLANKLYNYINSTPWPNGAGVWDDLQSGNLLFSFCLVLSCLVLSCFFFCRGE